MRGLWPQQEILVYQLHSEITFCNELVNDALKSCKVVSMTPQNSQINTAFVLAKKHLRAALDLGGSANIAIGTADVTVQDIGPGISGPSRMVPKKFKSRYKPPTSTVKTPVVSTGQTEPQDQGGVATAGAEGGAAEGGTQPQVEDPDNLKDIPDEELEGLEDVDDPDEESKFQSLYMNIVANLHQAQ